MSKTIIIVKLQIRIRLKQSEIVTGIPRQYATETEKNRPTLTMLGMYHF